MKNNDKSKISISIDTNINKKLEDNNYNKSKLINSLLNKWLLSEKKNIKIFTKK